VTEASAAGVEASSGATPQIAFTASSAMRMMPKVASTWTRWSRRYSRRMTRNSATAAIATVTPTATSTASANAPLASCTRAAT